MFIDIPLSRNEGAEELYRRLYEHHKVASLAQTTADFEKFGGMSGAQQAELITDMLAEMAVEGEFIIVDDQGGVYTDAGDFQPYFATIISELAGSSKPVIGFAQTRMMPFPYKRQYKSSYHTYLNPLPDDRIKELLSFSLKEAGVDFNEGQLRELESL